VETLVTVLLMLTYLIVIYRMAHGQ